MTTQEPPLSTPDYSATYLRALGRFFTRWARFKGRSSSRAFWFPALTIALGAVLLTVVQEWMARHPDIATEWAEALYQAMGIAGLALFIPALSLAWRRLHDAGMSGGWVLLGLFRVGRIILFFMLLRPKRPGPIRQDREDPELLDHSRGSSALTGQHYLVLAQVILLVFTAINFIAGMNNNYLLQVDGGPHQNHVEGAWNYMSFAAVLGAFFVVFFIASLIRLGASDARGYADQRA